MVTVEIQEYVNGKWEPRDCPTDTSERIEEMKKWAGKEAVIKIETSRQKVYLCGTEQWVPIVQNKHKGCAVMLAQGAYDMVQYDPEKFLITIQCFFTPTHVKEVFPDKPAKGWTRPVGE